MYALYMSPLYMNALYMNALYMNALYLRGTCRSPVFTDVHGQFGRLRRADYKRARTGVDWVGNGYLNLQRSADTHYCITPWTDTQRVISQAISQSSPISACAGATLSRTKTRHCDAGSGLRFASPRIVEVTPRGVLTKLRLAVH